MWQNVRSGGHRRSRSTSTDATDDRVHGQQLGRHFNGCYNHYIFLPLFVFRGDSGFCRPLILNW